MSILQLTVPFPGGHESKENAPFPSGHEEESSDELPDIHIQLGSTSQHPKEGTE